MAVSGGVVGAGVDPKLRDIRNSPYLHRDLFGRRAFSDRVSLLPLPSNGHVKKSGDNIVRQ
jgi:hypothetical protein